MGVLWFKKVLHFYLFCLFSVRDRCPCLSVLVCVSVGENESVCLCARMMHVCEGDGLMLVTPLVCNYYLRYHKLYE